MNITLHLFVQLAVFEVFFIEATASNSPKLKVRNSSPRNVPCKKKKIRKYIIRNVYEVMIKTV